jgi:tetratricopeptide (TPR) repeat protein
MFPQVEEASAQAIAANPGYPDFYMYIAMAQWAQQKDKTAIKNIKTGMKYASADSAFLNNAWMALGDIYYGGKKTKKTFECYEKSLNYNPNNATVLNNYAYYLSLLGKDLDRAYDMSKQAIDLDDKAEYLDTFAYILYLKGKYAEAKSFFRRAIAAGGDSSAVVLEHYADTLEKLGDRYTAEIYWSQALEKPDCANPDAIKKKLRK